MAINGEEAKAKILSLTVLHYPVSTCLNLSVFYCFRSYPKRRKDQGSRGGLIHEN